jgi:hypothetical protein
LFFRALSVHEASVHEAPVQEARGRVEVRCFELREEVPCLTTMAAGAPTPTAKAAMDATERVVMRDRRITPT